MSSYPGPAAVVILFKRREKIRSAVCPLMSRAGEGLPDPEAAASPPPCPSSGIPWRAGPQPGLNMWGSPSARPASLAQQITWNQSPPPPQRNHRNDFSFINHPYHPPCRRGRQYGFPPEKYFRPTISRATPKPPPLPFFLFLKSSSRRLLLPKEGTAGASPVYLILQHLHV